MSESSDSEPETSRAPPPLLEAELPHTVSGGVRSVPSRHSLLSEEDEDERGVISSPPPPPVPEDQYDPEPIPGDAEDPRASSNSPIVVDTLSSSRKGTPDPDVAVEESDKRPSTSPPLDPTAQRFSNLTPSPPPGKPENSAPRPKPGAVAAELAAEMAKAEAADLKRALMRKVAQLTKVVVHMNARNDESEARYERLRAGFEEEIGAIVKDAMLKAGECRKQISEMSAEEQLKVELQKQGEVFVGMKAEKRLELNALRNDVASRQDNLVEQGKGQIQRSVRELRSLEGEMRASLEAFRKGLGQSRAELEKRDTEIRDRRSAELQALAAEYKRRLDDVRTAHKREIESLNGAKEQALSHMSRLHESEMTMLRMQALQQRREKAHRLEQEFLEAKRGLEQLISHLSFELEQQQHDTADAINACKTTQKQIDGMRSSLHEMSLRVESGEGESSRAREEAAMKEAEAAALQGEVTVLQVRQKAAGITSAGFVLPPGVAPVKADTSTDMDLSVELREAIEGAKRLEVELNESDVALTDLDGDLTEKEKQIEILEVEIEEERLRNHQLQARILEREAAIKA